MRLAPLERADLVRCAELEKILFPGEDPWSVQAFQFELENGNFYLGAHVEPAGLVGYAGMSELGSPGHMECEIHTIGVDPGFQGQGIGRAMLVALLDRADTMNAPVFLEVRTDNVPAISLYKKHGFEQIGLRRRYYQPSGADAYTMARPGVTQ
ncbi:ribosomal-protein-alanine N-acetyltransferase [Kibdelosporangium banguiense]|uniref:[Ribosomal protein bS18]-alanine N-acetyltransferase n=1 Tax=Kibdelosporangium banguiense TaxID=1365924 RepID=A0ABS4TF94_9PSEU|nr:ribosomal protein S18-alanine N-acetyltransferase [Kibdelosporangium banguiense]MBP2322538.1 ribosomal-protein-alanine N-acetyltransferase [Kibdelosporangium banguiense]